MQEVLRCSGCGTTAPPSFVACPSCHRLFHADELRRLVAAADADESEERFLDALTHLRATLPLLPHESAQARALRERIAGLESRAGQSKGGAAKTPAVLASLGAFGAAIWKFAAPLLMLLSKAKFLFFGLFKAKTLFSMLFMMSLYGREGSRWSAVLWVASIYVHEIGHVFAFQRYGIEVSAPMFVPGFGAFVRGSHYPEAPRAQADVALSGPFWGAAAAAILVVLGVALHQPWLALTAVGVAEVNQFNLIPVWQLDGSRAIAVLAPRQRLILGGVGLVVGVASGSVMGSIAALGHLVRGAVGAGDATPDAAVLRKFLSLVLLLGAIRGAAAYLGAT